MSDIKELERIEAGRCAALVKGDVASVEALLAGDLVHIHLTGQVDDKPGYLSGLREKYTFERVERGALTIRVYGDLAVMIGPLSQRVQVRATGQSVDVRAITTQTWLRTAQGWRLNTCHNAVLPA